MALKREDALKMISERVAWLAMLCDIRGAIHLFDGNTISHEFFARLLNEVFDLKLLVMDRIQANFPAIDLGDETNKRSLQITAEKGSDKIQNTLNKYVKHDLPNKYGKIQVVVVGEKQGSYKNLTVPASLTFVPDDDIIDTKGLIKVIEGLSTEKLEHIAKIVQAEIKTADFPTELYLHVSAHNEPRDSWPGSDDTRMAYLAEQVGGTIVIRPVMPYLDRMAAGGPIEPLRYITPTMCPFEWNLPALDFKLLNRTPVSFLLAEAIFDVEESRLDTRPVLVVMEDVRQSTARAFWLVNEGATVLEDVIVRYEMLPGKVPAPATFPDDYPFSHSVGVFEHRAEIQVGEAFVARGVSIEELDTLLNVVGDDGKTVTVQSESGVESTMTLEEHEAAIKRSLGPFVDEVGTIIGAIEFVEPSCGQRQVVRFRAVVYIINVNRKLRPRPPSAVYHVELATVGNNYRRCVPISQELQPGETDRFLMKVAVTESSNHRFRVTFCDVGGQTIQSPWIQLRCFVPRTRRGRVEAEQASASKDDS